MSLTFTTGKTFASGEVVTPAKLNQIGNSLSYAGELEVAKGGTGASTAAAARTALGLFGSNLEHTVVGNIQTGTLATDLIYTSGPTLSLTEGVWIVWGSAVMRTTDSAGEFWLGLRDTTAGTDFGKGATQQNESLAVLYHMTAFGFITVGGGGATVRLKGFISGSKTLEMGSTNGISGALRAVLLTT